MVQQVSIISRVRRAMRGAALCSVLAASMAPAMIWLPDHAAAASQRILVVVNDQPITNRDVDQRLKLNAALGDKQGSREQRQKKVLKRLIDEVIARSEAKKLGLKFDQKRVDKAIADMAKGSGSTVENMTGSLKKKGIGISTLRSQVESMLTVRWIVRRNSKTKVEVNEAEVDRRYKKFSSDPRLKPVTVMLLHEVDLPVEKGANEQLLYARAVESQQISRQYKGCKSLRKAAKGVFNVKISRLIQAPVDKMPKQMRDVLIKAGTKKLIGPIKAKTGIRMIAYCGKKHIKPPKPPREAVKNIVLREKYEKVNDRVMRDLRRKAFIEYKDSSAALTQ
ncbi:MAG: SurA N-terminal domain-containing protein [Aestuariivirgaceae bacterium]